MSVLALNNIALKFWLTTFLVKSWCEHFDFNSEVEADIFFEENIF